MSSLLSNEKIIELITVTYTSPSTSEIEEAFQILINNAFDAYPKTFTQLEDILAKNQYHIDINCKKAIINLIKVSGQRILDKLSLLNKTEDDVVNKHKKLLHAIQHIYDNKQIPSALKAPIGQLYIDLFLFFTPENYPRLLSKSKFYFNTKQHLLALNLTQSFLPQKMPLKYKFPFCESYIELMVTQLDKKMQSIVQQERQLSQQSHQTLHKFLIVLTDLWTKMTFQKFQTVFHKIFTSLAFFNIITNFQNQIFGRFWKKYLYYIFSIIIRSVGRCNLYNKYENMIQFIRSYVSLQFEAFMNGEEDQTSTLTLISAAVEYKLLQISLSSFDIFSKFIYPNYLIIEKYLESQVDNLAEVINFLDDATFYMESEVIGVLRHKILYFFCKNNEQTSLAFRSIISTFFCRHVGSSDIKRAAMSINLPEGIEVWNRIKEIIDEAQQIQVILLYSAISANFFISEIEFMKKIEQFTTENEDFLLENPNKRIVFYSLLLYKNYMDDIFSINMSRGFRQKIFMLALNNQTDQTIKKFALETIKLKLSQKPAFQEYSTEIELIIKKMAEDYKEQIIPLTIVIFREFGQFINGEAAISIIKQTLSIWKEAQIHLDKKSEHLQLLKLFLNIQSCSQFYSHLIEELVQVAHQNVGLIQRHIEDFLDVMAKGLQVCKALPAAFEETMVKFDLTVKDAAMMEIMNQLLLYSTQGCFFNWLAIMLTKNSLNVYEILLIHNLIYYGNKFLNYQSIRRIISISYLERILKKNNFDYRNGKINLIFLFLLKYMWKETNDILLNEDWNDLIENGRSMLTIVNQLGRNEQFVAKPFIQRVYDLVYKEENVYRWKYDIQMFLVNQLDLFKYQLHDKYQFMYANLTFIACTMNILRAYEFIQNHYIQDCSDSDDSIYPHTKLEREYRESQQIINHHTVPMHLKQTDYFTIYRKLVINLRKDENSKKWVETIFQTIFKKEHYEAFDNVMKTEKNSQGYRKINRIRRTRHEDHNQA